ncbi:hypothetical protein RAA17_21790 [Komagataeibacter rhaeticus]|nr:hypothetical protein [Komagataeibacter rhaeticus]
MGIYPNAKNADTADPIYGNIVSQEYGAALKIHAKLGENDLNFISAWRGSTYDNNTPVDLVPLNVYAYYPYNYGQLSTQKFSDEIRFLPQGKFMEWLAGGFFNRLDARQTQYQWGTAGSPLYVNGQPAQTLYNNEGAVGQSGNTSLSSHVTNPWPRSDS